MNQYSSHRIIISHEMYDFFVLEGFAVDVYTIAIAKQLVQPIHGGTIYGRRVVGKARSFSICFDLAISSLQSSCLSPAGFRTKRNHTLARIPKRSLCDVT